MLVYNPRTLHCLLSRCWHLPKSFVPYSLEAGIRHRYLPWHRQSIAKQLLLEKFQSLLHERVVLEFISVMHSQQNQQSWKHRLSNFLSDNTALANKYCRGYTRRSANTHDPWMSVLHILVHSFFCTLLYITRMTCKSKMIIVLIFCQHTGAKQISVFTRSSMEHLPVHGFSFSTSVFMQYIDRSVHINAGWYIWHPVSLHMHKRHAYRQANPMTVGSLWQAGRWLVWA